MNKSGTSTSTSNTATTNQEVQEVSPNTGKATPPLYSSGNEENEGDGSQDENDKPSNQESESETGDGTVQGKYTPIVEGAYSPGSPGQEGGNSPKRHHESELTAHLRYHRYFVKGLAGALTQSTKDHASTWFQVADSLTDLHERILRQLEEDGDGAKYMKAFYDTDPYYPRRTKRQRRPSPTDEQKNVSQSSSCGPDCPG